MPFETARRRKLAVVLIVCLCVWALWLFLASHSTLWDRDEARYATAALEMSNSGNWLYPTFNHELRPFKPVLVYWLMAASIEVLGPTELAVRLISTLALLGVCVITGLIARQFLGSGRMAAIIAATSPILVLNGVAATTDATLLAFVLMAEGVFVHAWLHGPRKWHVPVMGAAIGLAMLTKGPVGLAVPVLSIAATLVLARGRSQAGPFALRLTCAAALGVLIFLAWGIPANFATSGEFWRVAIAEGLPKYMFSAMENHGGEGFLPFLLHLPYYPLVLAVGFLPWTMYLPMVPGSFQKDLLPPSAQSWARGPQGLRTLLTGMILPTMILMTLLVSKLPHYIQPVFPWLAIMVASALAASGDCASTKLLTRRMRVSFLIFGIPGLLLGLALVALPWFWPAVSAFRVGGAVIGLLALGLLPVLGFCFWRGQIQMAAKIHAVAVLVFLLVLGVFVLPVLEGHAKPAQTLARDVQNQIPIDAEVATYGWREPGMHFYLGARQLYFIYDPLSLEKWLSGSGPKTLIVNEDHAGEIELPPKGFRQISSQRGWNVVNGKQIQLSAFLRNGTKN